MIDKLQPDRGKQARTGDCRTARAEEATQAFAQDSVEAYMDFVNSMFSYYQGTVAEAQRQAGGPQR